MRILILPEFYLQNVMATSGVRMCWSLAKNLARRGNNIYLAFPQKSQLYAKDWKVNVELVMGWMPDNRVQPIFFPCLNPKYQATVLVPEFIQYLNQDKCKFAYDVIIDWSRPRSLILKKIINESFWESYRVDMPVVNFIDDLCLPGKPHFKNEIQSLIDVMGAVCDYAAITNTYNRDLLFKAVRSYAQPSLVREIMQRCESVGIPVEFDRFEEIYYQKRANGFDKKKDKVTVFYGGSLMGVKHVDKMVEFVEKARMMGYDVDMVISTMTSPTEKSKKWEEYPWLEIHYEVDAEGYVQYLKKGDVYFCFSDSEGGGVGFIEMMASGLVGIYRTQAWLNGRIPPMYPFVGKTWEDCFTIFVTVLKELKERESGVLKTEWFDEVHSWVLENYDAMKVAERVERICKKAVDRAQRKRSWVDDVLKESGVLNQDEISFEEVCKRMKAASKKSVDFGFGKMVNGFYVRKLMKDNGYEDVGDVNSIVFKR